MFLNSERTNKSLQIIYGQCNYDFVEQNEHEQSKAMTALNCAIEKIRRNLN